MGHAGYTQRVVFVFISSFLCPCFFYPLRSNLYFYCPSSIIFPSLLSDLVRGFAQCCSSDDGLASPDYAAELRQHAPDRVDPNRTTELRLCLSSSILLLLDCATQAHDLACPELRLRGFWC
jgi:hypothetical protein